MKQSKILLFFLITAAALSSSGCAHLPASGDDRPDLHSPPPFAPEEVLIRVDYATDELLSEYKSFINEYVEIEYAQKILLRTNTAAKDFRFIEIGFKEEETDIKFFEKEVLYTTEELLPEEPLVVGVSFPGILPTRGISFTDEDHITKYFYIAQSGKDGSVFLAEFEPIAY